MKAGNGRTELLDHSDRLVTNGQAFFHRILAPENMHVSSTDRRGRNPDERVERTNLWNRLFIKDNATRLDKTAALINAIEDLLGSIVHSRGTRAVVAAALIGDRLKPSSNTDV